MRVMRALATLVAVAALAACSVPLPGAGGAGAGGAAGGSGGGAGGGKSGSVPDPCTIVTKDEATAALAAPAGDGQTFGTTERTCSFRPVKQDFQYLSIKIDAGGRPGYDNSYTIKKDTFPAFAEIAGLGDAAFTIGKEITVLKGDFVTVYFLGGVTDNADAHARVRALATAGTGRL